MTAKQAHNRLADSDDRFDSFFSDRYRPMVNLACGLVDQRAIAEEVAQDAFQQVWLRWDKLDEPSFYLRTTVVNRCHDELRKRRVRREAGALEAVMVEAESHYLADVLSEVTPKRRRALILRYYGGHTVSEVARAMDIPAGTVKSLIHRGLADMRGALN